MQLDEKSAYKMHRASSYYQSHLFIIVVVFKREGRLFSSDLQAKDVVLVFRTDKA